MMLVLAALVLAAAQEGALPAPPASPGLDGLYSIPPPQPLPRELAATFSGALRRAAAFAPASGRVIQPSMQGILTPGAPYPAWIVEFQWKEKGGMRPGVAIVVDVIALEKHKPGSLKATEGMREGDWVAAQVLEGQTLAAWSQKNREQRRENNESMTVSNIRMVIVGQAVFQSSSGSYGELGCLTAPASCLPGSREKAMLDAPYAAPEQHGYRFSFHPGAPVKGKGKATGLLSTWAYTATPMDPLYGRRAFCGDSSGAVCAVAEPTMPNVVGGLCPKSCLALP